MINNNTSAPAEQKIKKCLAIIDETENKLHAVAQRIDAIAIADARRCDALNEAGVSLGPLHGVPFAVKDIIDVGGVVTRSGSLTTVNNAPAKIDAPVVSALRAAGAVPVVKTNTVEFAIGGWGTNETVGTPHNPWDTQTHRVPGGSSSGTGVLVGGGILPAGLGTDTGGSVRIPTAFCGCVGLKTSIGLLCRMGVSPLSETLDTVGPLTQTVTMAAHMFHAMLGTDNDDSTTVARCKARTLRELNRGNTGLRFGVLPYDAMPDLTDDVRASFEKALKLLQDSGATLASCQLPMTLENYQQRTGMISATEAYATYQEIVDDDSSTMALPNRTRMRAGAKVSAAELVSARRQRLDAIESFESVIDGFDAIVLPTLPITAIPVADVDEADMIAGSHTRFVNYLELAALAVPIDITSAGLPTSLQIVTRRFDDPLALRIGAAFEAVRGDIEMPYQV